jgi:hypothetical protein
MVRNEENEWENIASLRVKLVQPEKGGEKGVIINPGKAIIMPTKTGFCKWLRADKLSTTLNWTYALHQFDRLKNAN